MQLNKLLCYLKCVRWLYHRYKPAKFMHLEKKKLKNNSMIPVKAKIIRIVTEVVPIIQLLDSRQKVGTDPWNIKLVCQFSVAFGPQKLVVILLMPNVD